MSLFHVEGKLHSYHHFVRDSQQSASIIFSIGSKRGKIHHNEIGKGQTCEREADEQKTMRFIRLQDICDGRNDIGNVCRQHEFAKSAIDKSERRNGINKDKNLPQAVEKLEQFLLK